MRVQVLIFFMISFVFKVFAGDTELHFYRPMTQSTKQPPIRISQILQGQCTQQSLRIKREDAWQCIANGRRWDPCFVQPYGDHLNALCIDNPWATVATQIQVATPLNNHQHSALDMSKTLPWAVELAGGTLCLAIENPSTVEGLMVHYQCEGQTLLLGDIQRCHNVWEVLQQQNKHLQLVQLAKVWF